MQNAVFWSYNEIFYTWVAKTGGEKFVRLRRVTDGLLLTI